MGAKCLRMTPSVRNRYKMQLGILSKMGNEVVYNQQNKLQKYRIDKMKSVINILKPHKRKAKNANRKVQGFKN